MRRLLLIDDHEHLAPPLAAFFKRHGFELQHATRPSQGLALLHNPGPGGAFEAAILDVMLPEMDGFELCRTIRRSTGPVGTLPLLMLTARGDVMDRVVGLEMGADDYLPKPFEPRELLARIQTVLRRVLPSAPGPAAHHAGSTHNTGLLQFEDLVVDLDRRQVLVQGRAAELTSTEFELLVLLARTRALTQALMAATAATAVTAVTAETATTTRAPGNGRCSNPTATASAFRCWRRPTANARACWAGPHWAPCCC